ncbi:MAG: hypothetical protein RLZZ387_1821 [Chloroflexota bacterium]
MRLLLLLALVPLALAASVAAQARPFPSAALLYDGARGTTPSRQGFTLLTVPLVGASSGQTYADGGTILDSTPVQSESAGYFASAALVPPLDRAAGYSLEVTLQLLEERHQQSDRDGDGVADRAGFSLIALSSDVRGIEVGFWPDRVWAQADDRTGAQDLFTQAEGAALDTSRLLTYELRVRDDAYTLLVGGEEVLSGPLRDYRPFVAPIDPYETPNLIFLGDDTGQASARVRLLRAAVYVGGRAVMLPVVRGPEAQPARTRRN